MIGAVDIGGTKIAAGMVNDTGELVANIETASKPQLGPEAGISKLIEMLHETCAQAGGTLQGIGIGCTGPVDPLTGKLGRIEFLPGWEGKNLVDELQGTFQVSAALENDADAAALGEFAWGAGKEAERFIYVTISTGIGGGIVLDGHLYRGAGNSHPEIGHHVIDPSGPPCFCGAQGCWESLASGPALARSAGKATAFEVCEAARRGDVLARAAVDREGLYLGLGLANLITIFLPDMIALGGGVIQSFDLFEAKVTETIRSTCGLVPFERTRLVPAALGRDVGLVGAAQVWKKRFEK